MKIYISFICLDDSISMKQVRNILVVFGNHDSLYDESGVVCYQYGNGTLKQEFHLEELCQKTRQGFFAVFLHPKNL